MVDAGIWGGVCHCFEGGASPVGVSGRRHFPWEVNLGLVDARLLAALLHHRVLWVVRITRGDAHQGVAWRGQLLTALFCHLLDVVVVGQWNHLRGRRRVNSWNSRNFRQVGWSTNPAWDKIATSISQISTGNQHVSTIWVNEWKTWEPDHLRSKQWITVAEFFFTKGRCFLLQPHSV